MNGVCSKCSGEGHVMVQDEDVHWHWEACPDCNGFEEMALAANVTFDSWGDAPPFDAGDVSPWQDTEDRELNDDLPW